jgi:hypothetical protein
MSTFINELPQYQNSPENSAGINNSSGMNPNIANQLINELNEASIKGETSLPQRDIPSQTINNTIDEQATPNYVPTGEKFIPPSDENVIQYYNNKVTRSEKMDKIYEELQTPILLSILFFLFQLPIFRNTMFKLFPFMFSKDGNANIQGYFGFSLFFGIFYYLINKLMIIINF